MTQQFPYTFVCEKCGGTFYSKTDTSSWRHHVCNACAGKQYKDYPVPGTTPGYNPQPVPTAKPVYNNVPPRQVEKKEFNIEEYATDLFICYCTIKATFEKGGCTIPEESLCAWATSAMIQKGRG